MPGLKSETSPPMTDDPCVELQLVTKGGGAFVGKIGTGQKNVALRWLQARKLSLVLHIAT